MNDIATSGFDCFITRKEDRLLEGDKEFRFVSMNIPNLHVNEDPLPHWHRIDPWEIEDAFKTINLMGGRVTRMYTLSIAGGVRPGNGKVHIYGPGRFDEDLFTDLDRVLLLANLHKVRIVIPFIDQWDWFGGIKHFAGFYGKNEKEFWTDPQIIRDFKETISNLVNRTNKLTGVKYKDDKAILAWETGNELDCPDEWTAQIVSHIRSLDHNHLIMDGKYGISQASLSNPNVDIVSNHYYVDRGTDLLSRVLADRTLSKGKKVFYVGEFHHENPAVMESILEAVCSNGISGALAWSLRYHNKEGGFYYQGDPTNPNTGCYNWPGFDSRMGKHEIARMECLRNNAYRIQEIPVPPKPIPETPVLLPIDSPQEIGWRGSAGAECYVLERALRKDGPWTIVSDRVMEDSVPYVPYSDNSVKSGTFYYRISAKNCSGTSIPSNVEAVTWKPQQWGQIGKTQ